MSRVWSKYLALRAIVAALLFGSVAAHDVSAEEQDAWNAAKGSGTQEAYHGYLKEFPDGNYAEDAAVILAGMLDADPERGNPDSGHGGGEGDSQY